MAIHEPVPIDLKTVTILRKVWRMPGTASYRTASHDVKDGVGRTHSRSAAKGEHDRKRLLAAALNIAA